VLKDIKSVGAIDKEMGKPTADKSIDVKTVVKLHNPDDFVDDGDW